MRQWDEHLQGKALWEEKETGVQRGVIRTKQELGASRFEKFPVAVMRISSPLLLSCFSLNLDAGEIWGKTSMLPFHKVLWSREAQDRFYPFYSPTKMSPPYWRSRTRDNLPSSSSVPRLGCCSVSFEIFYIWKNTPGLSLPRLSSRRSGVSSELSWFFTDFMSP